MFKAWRRRQLVERAKRDAIRPAPSAPPRHWTVDQFPCVQTPGAPGFWTGYHGSRIRAEHLATQDLGAGYHPVSAVPFSDEYFEWTDLFEAILSAGDTFTFAEIGAGYGRWSSNAAAAARLKGKRVRLALVEAEPQHLAWIPEHMVDNGIDPSSYFLVAGAVGASSKRTRLSVGMPTGRDSPAEWYGQATGFPEGDLHIPDGEYMGRPATACGGYRFIEVQQVLLSDVIAPYQFVDLLDMDVQGAEAAAVRGSLETLNAKVRRLHIETHNHEVEVELRTSLGDAGWACLRDLECWTTHETPFGSAYFEGGVQTWLNPRLVI